MWRVLPGLMWLLVCPGWANAERFLTVTEAQKICFPTATRFEPRTVRLSAADQKRIEGRAGVRVRNTGNQYWLAWADTNLVGVLVQDHVVGKHELIDYVVAIGPDAHVRQIEILVYRESYGGEIRRPKWRQQFRGKSTRAPLELNDDIYNISGATLSCRHVTEGVKRVLATYELAIAPGLQRSAGMH